MPDLKEPTMIPIQQTSSGTTGCGCGGHDDGIPVFDVRTVPHAIRHAAVFGAFDAIAPGDSPILIAPHAPLPLLAQLSERAPIEVRYLSEGPQEWRIQLTRLPGEAN